jgi:hypothetical protein
LELRAFEFLFVSSSQRLSRLNVFSSHVWLIRAFSAMHMFIILQSVATHYSACGGSYEEGQMHIRFREGAG